MFNWKKINCYLIIALCLLSGFKYRHEYIDLLNNKFLPDGIRFFLFAMPITIYCAIFLFNSIKKNNYIAAGLDFIAGFSQLLVIGLRGRIIPIYGMVMSGTIILLATLIWILEIYKGRRLSH